MTAAERAGAPLLDRPGTFWIVALLIALLFATTNLPWHLDNYDQAKQAFTSFEIVNDGPWLYQHTPNEKIATKPPLVGWISAALFGVTRSPDVAWRLPSFVAAVLLLVMLTRAASQAYGAIAGLIAMSAFGLNMLSPRLATLVRTDMPLALLVFLLGLQIWRKIRTRESWTTRDRMFAFAVLSAAMLVKGPIGYAFLLPGIVVFQLTRRSGSASAWAGWWPWLASLGLFAAWVGGGIASVPGFYDQVVLREFAGRFGETVHRPQPFYFYIPHLLHKFAPWSLLLIALAVTAWRGERGAFGERWRRLSPETAWPICWSLGGILVMSLIPSKRVDRIFPVIPPLCLLVAAQFAAMSATTGLAARVRRWTLVALLVGCVVSSGYTAQKVVRAYRDDRGALARFGAAVRTVAAANGWRYEVIGGKEEGLLLYLRRTRFIPVDEAVEKWNAATIDALVAPADELPRLLEAMRGAAPSGLEASVEINDQTRRYVLLKRTAP